MSKEHAYAYEAGYRDGSVHYELEHCPACKNIADLQESLEENAKLIVKLNAEHIVRQNVEVENAKLRNQLHDQQDTAQHNFVRNAREYKRVCDENDRLRELVSELWTHCPADRYYCSLCEYGNDDGSECKLADRLHELGVDDA